MKYLLDTNICVYFLNGNESLTRRFEKYGAASLVITCGVLSELYYGAYNSGRVSENVKRIDSFKDSMAVIPETVESARLFGKIKSELRSKGRTIDDFDVLLASIAIAESFIVVTNNLS